MNNLQPLSIERSSSSVFSDSIRRGPDGEPCFINIDSDLEAPSVSFATMNDDGNLDRSSGSAGDFVGFGSGFRSSSQLDFDDAIFNGELSTFLTTFESTEANIKQYLCSVAERIRNDEFCLNDKMRDQILSFITDYAMCMDPVRGLGEFYDVFKIFYSNIDSRTCRRYYGSLSFFSSGFGV